MKTLAVIKREIWTALVSDPYCNIDQWRNDLASARDAFYRPRIVAAEKRAGLVARKIARKTARDEAGKAAIIARATGSTWKQVAERAHRSKYTIQRFTWWYLGCVLYNNKDLFPYEESWCELSCDERYRVCAERMGWITPKS